VLIDRQLDASSSVQDRRSLNLFAPKAPKRVLLT
jgi:hypothetical protein